MDSTSRGHADFRTADRRSMPIRVLPSLLVNQIAAGEVIERPASVVKELIENSLDAGATRIEITTEAGGRDLIEVCDDGHGIPADELALALAPHATSKIAVATDLDAILTMGFRGEAMASIASVAQLRLRSRPHDESAGAEVSAEGDRLDPVRPAASPPGTIVTVRNLFFNVPARRKFLRTDATESARIAETVAGLAMAHPEVGFRLRQDGRTQLDVPADSEPRRRAVEIIGVTHDAELLEVADPAERASESVAGASSGGSWIRIWGLVGTPALARSNGRAIRIFVNGRSIVDRSLAHAVREAYRGLIDPTRHPTAAIFLRVDPQMVDVNVHPKKSEVRFRSGDAVHGALLRAVRGALRGADLVPELLPDALRGLDSGQVGAASGGVAWTRSPFVGTAAHAAPRPTGFPLEGARAAIADAESATEQRLPVVAGAVTVLQVHRRYLVVEDEQGLLVIDQHALHERLMFERIRDRLGSGSLPTQRLLAPTIVPADRARRERMEECGTLLRRLGIEATDAGAAGIAIHAFPVLLLERRVAIEPFIAALLDRAATGDLRTDEEAALASVVSMMACKASVRSGDRLPPEEIAELLRRRERLERSSSCPHGRPTTLRLSLRELDRHFGRT